MDAEALYQEKILALARFARSRPRLEGPALTGSASNPVCGDRVLVDLDTGGGGRIAAMGARVDGCALCEAAAGLMIQALEGSGLDGAADLHPAIARWLAGDQAAAVVDGQDAFTPVKAFRARHRCVTLPFEALAEAAAGAR